MANIFNIDWNNVVLNLTPWFWRDTTSGAEAKLIPYERSMIKPVQDVSTDLYNFETETTEFLSYTGQHKVLEEYLNNNYDNTLRRIYITENDIASIDTTSMYQSGETNPDPISMYQSGETNPTPIAFYQAGEGISGDNFTVYIPFAVTFDSTVVTSQLRNYVEASKNFNIVTI
jgi:hypothetical protein